MSPLEPADIDKRFLERLRGNVDQLLQVAASSYIEQGDRVLDVAPQIYQGIRQHVAKAVVVETLDIDPQSGATYIADICSTNSHVPSAYFDHIVCTEVLEHTLRPFDAVDEIFRLLKPGGWLFLSTPFAFRIHGPLPDCWRFTEHGLRSLLRDFQNVEIQPLEDEDRPLMPIHYTTIAQRPT